MKKSVNRKGQVWVETVIYTLIGLAILGIILAIVKPQIDEMKDKAVVDQSIENMLLISEKIDAASVTSGSSRVADVQIKKGKVVVNAQEDYIRYIQEDSRIEFSEPGVNVPFGRLNVTTTQKVELYDIAVSLYYYDIDIRFDGDTDKIREFEAGPTPYKVKIVNKGLTDATNDLHYDPTKGPRVIIDISY